MAWQKNGTPDTLGSSGDIMAIADLTAKKFNQFMSHGIMDTTFINNNITFNSNTNSVYAFRASYNGGADATSTSAASFLLDGSSTADDKFFIMYVVSISGEEKLCIANEMNNNTAGAANAPRRTETVAKFVPSPDADITEITSTNGGAGSYDTSSNLSALGTD